MGTPCRFSLPQLPTGKGLSSENVNPLEPAPSGKAGTCAGSLEIRIVCTLQGLCLLRTS